MDKTNASSRFGGRDNGISDDDALLHEGGVLPKDFPQRLERLKEASGLSWGALARAHRRGPQVPDQVAQEGRRALWRRDARHLPLRGPDARRPGEPHGRGPPDEPLREGALDQRPRRAQGARGTAGPDRRRRPTHALQRQRRAYHSQTSRR